MKDYYLRDGEELNYLSRSVLIKETLVCKDKEGFTNPDSDLTQHHIFNFLIIKKGPRLKMIFFFWIDI